MGYFSNNKDPIYLQELWYFLKSLAMHCTSHLVTLDSQWFLTWISTSVTRLAIQSGHPDPNLCVPICRTLAWGWRKLFWLQFSLFRWKTILAVITIFDDDPNTFFIASEEEKFSKFWVVRLFDISNWSIQRDYSSLKYVLK